MGLDMYLMKDTYVGNRHDKPKDQAKIEVEGVQQSRVSGVEETIGYWRKANAIHGWFVKHVQEGVDDCGRYRVSEEQLTTLLEIVEDVLKASELVEGRIQNGTLIKNGKATPNMEDGKYIKDPTVAKELLPVVGGFFFGNSDEDTAYNQWYYEDLEETVKILKEALSDSRGDYYYHSSW